MEHTGITRTMRSFISAVLLSAAAVTAATVTDIFSAAEAAQNAGDWTRVETLYRTGMLSYPHEIGLATGHIWALVNLKRHREAVDEAARLYRSYPANRYARESYRDALINCGWALQAKGESNAVFTPLFTEAYRLDPTNQWSMNAYGYMLRETGRYGEATEVLSHAMTLYPSDTYIRGNLFWTYIAQANSARDRSNYAAAEILYRKAGGIDATNESYYLHYGLMLRAASNYTGAIALFDEGARRYPASRWLEPNLRYTMLDHERALASRGDTNGAIAAAAKALARWPVIWLLLDLSDYHRAQKSYEQAGNYLAQASHPEALAGEHLERGITVDDLIVPRLDGLVFQHVLAKNYPAAFSLIDDIERSCPGAWFITAIRGRVTYHAGKTVDGIALEYRAYNIYRAAHPECAVPLTVAPPLTGMYIVGGNSRTNAITHAGMNRYAFDFSGCDRNGETRRRRADGAGVNEDYLGFGTIIRSPVDGIVEGVRDDAPDITPSFTAVLGEGNYIWILDAAGRHHILVHNRRGSAKVLKGERVRTGQPVAEMGNSGYSSTPHLHFAVYTPDWFVTLPVNFTSFIRVSKENLRAVNAVPLDGEIIEFRE